jgi:hypothetical protein
MIRQLNQIQIQIKLKRIQTKKIWTYLWKKANKKIKKKINKKMNKKINKNQNSVVVSPKSQKMITNNINKHIIRILIKKIWVNQKKMK